MKGKSTKAEIKASREYEKRNRRKTTLDNYRRTAKMYIKKHAKLEDLEEFKKFIEERENELKEDGN